MTIAVSDLIKNDQAHLIHPQHHSSDAAEPMVVVLSSGFSFEQYAGTATVGIGAVDVDDTLFFIEEQAAAGAQSWLIFADTASRSQVSA